jgi:hypothetical protein
VSVALLGTDDEFNPAKVVVPVTSEVGMFVPVIFKTVDCSIETVLIIGVLTEVLSYSYKH